jgi:hypothetical protein
LEEGGYRKDAGFGKREDFVDTGIEKRGDNRFGI